MMWTPQLFLVFEIETPQDGGYEIRVEAQFHLGESEAAPPVSIYPQANCNIPEHETFRYIACGQHLSSL